MDWSDLGLRLIRASGALASALAGIAALMTDGAFTKREQPRTGKWKDFPFSRYQITPWGATLLGVILIAPTVQFVGDWMKDDNDAKALRETADAIRRDINGTVNESTDKARSDISQTVRQESQIQQHSAQQLVDQQQAIGRRTSTIAGDAADILAGVNRSLNPLTDVRVTYYFRAPIDAPELAGYRQRLEQGLSDDLSAPANSAGSHAASVLRSKADGTALTANIFFVSSLMPRIEETIPYYVLRCTGVWLDFRRTPATDSGSGNQLPDLVLTAGTGHGDSNSINYSFDYDFKTRGLVIRGDLIRADPPFRTNGRIKSVLDLAGAELEVRIEDDEFPAIAPDGGRTLVDLEISRIRSELQLQALFIDVNGRQFFLRDAVLHWKRTVKYQPEAGGTVTYSMTLPSDLTKLEPH